MIGYFEISVFEISKVYSSLGPDPQRKSDQELYCYLIIYVRAFSCDNFPLHEFYYE